MNWGFSLNAFGGGVFPVGGWGGAAPVYNEFGTAPSYPLADTIHTYGTLRPFITRWGEGWGSGLWGGGGWAGLTGQLGTQIAALGRNAMAGAAAMFGAPFVTAFASGYAGYGPMSGGPADVGPPQATAPTETEEAEGAEEEVDKAQNAGSA